MTSPRRMILAILVALACRAGDAAEPTSAPIPVRIGYDGFSMTTTPMYYTQQKGLFKKHGLDVTLIQVQGGSQLSQAVLGGSVDLAQNGYTPAAAAAVEGGDIVIIGGISNKLPFQLVVKPSLASAEQLKGKKIAISRFGSSTDIAAQFALEHLGLKKGDVALLQLGGEGTRTAALMSGQVDGSMEQYPRTAELEEAGFKVLVDVTHLAKDYPNTAYTARRAYIARNPEVVRRFFKAISEGLRRYKNDPEEAVRLSAQFLNVKVSPALRTTYERYSREVFPDVPLPSRKGLELVLAELASSHPRAASMRPEQLVDTTALDQLQREGFFQTLR
ncbi:MAG TPA: ABC transporter substrate-binding protein [Myxococcaceae bacterium]|nr:ABC transporter substrate-binding protein [Myxococcaceae bacterium]